MIIGRIFRNRQINDIDASIPSLENVVYTDQNTGIAPTIDLTVTGETDGFGVQVETLDGPDGAVIEFVTLPYAETLSLIGFGPASNSTNTTPAGATTNIRVTLVNLTDPTVTSNALTRAVSGLDFSKPVLTIRRTSETGFSIYFESTEALFGTPDHTAIDVFADSVLTPPTGAQIANQGDNGFLATFQVALPADATLQVTFSGAALGLKDADGNFLADVTLASVQNLVVPPTVLTIDSLNFTAPADGVQANLDVAGSYDGADTLEAYFVTGTDPLTVSDAQIIAGSGGTNTLEFANSALTGVTGSISISGQLTSASEPANRVRLLIKEANGPAVAVSEVIVSGLDYTDQTLNSSVPADDATDVVKDAVQTFTFEDEPSGDLIYRLVSDDSIVSTIDLGLETATGGFTVSVTGNEASITPSGLADNTAYWVDTAGVKDEAGNPIDVASTSTTLRFTTAAAVTAPTMSLVDALTQTFSVSSTAATFDTSSISVGDEIYLVATKEGGIETTGLTGIELGGVALGSPTAQSDANVSRMKAYGWRTTATAAMIGASTSVEVDGVGTGWTSAIFKIDGTITTETFSSDQFTNSTDPLDGSVNTGNGAAATVAIVEDINNGTAPFVWAGSTQVGTAITTAGNEHYEFALTATTPATPRTITATHGLSTNNDHGAILTLAVS